MWIDTDKIRFSDYDPNEKFSADEEMSEQEQMEFERMLDQKE